MIEPALSTQALFWLAGHLSIDQANGLADVLTPLERTMNTLPLILAYTDGLLGEETRLELERFLASR